ncbi:MAG TPA: hypothetical protein VGQ72_05520 [Pyrinomonadaceae bacterium]|nr:hypothetical protein [Pyrinomonadaceae bacterium]
MTSAVSAINSRRLRIASLAAFVLVVSAIAPLTIRAQFLHPKIKKNETTIHNVVIMPAKVEVVRDSMKGPEGMAAESEELSGRVEKMVAEVLANKKHVKTLNTPAAGSGEGDPQAKYSIADFQTKFDDLLPRIMKKRSDVKKGRFTMGDEILNMNVDKSADAIVFVRGQGQKLTSGKKAFTIFVGGAPAFLKMQIGMIDARTGEVLLYTDPILVGDPTTAIDRLRKALEKGFKKLPAAP